jgi:SAM-dependent methyltransferase
MLSFLRKLAGAVAPGLAAPGAAPGTAPPEHMLRRRFEVSRRWLKGNGIEIGALNSPLQVGRRARVRYVDRQHLDALRAHYPEFGAVALAPVDVVDDGEKLATFAPDSLDFIIANHMLEHCENPLGAIRSHLSRVRRGGVLYYAIPDGRFTFDRDRPLTPFEHLVADDRDGGAAARAGHYEEYVRLVDKLSGTEAEERVRKLMDMAYSIHFHVWDHDGYRRFLDDARAYLGAPFRLELFEQNDFELLAILVKA